MSSDKITFRGLGDSGSTRRSWSSSHYSSGRQSSARETSFVMGSRNMSPKRDRQEKASGFVYSDSCEHGRAKTEQREATSVGLLSRGAIVQGVTSVIGGDRASLPLERYLVPIALFGGMVLLAFAVRWFASDSGQRDWIDERRAVVEYR